MCRGKKDAEDEDDVNGWITLGFALGGVGFDLMCLMEFYKSNKKPDGDSMYELFVFFLRRLEKLRP